MPDEFSPNKPLQRAYIKLVTAYPRSVLLVLAALLIALLAGLPNFKLDASADSLTLENDRDLDFFRETSARYDTGDFLFVTYRPKKDLFSDESLEILVKLQQDLANVTGVVGTNSILDVPLLYSPKQSLSELTKSPRTLLVEGMDRAAARQEFWNSPIYKELILGSDGQTTAIQLNLEVDAVGLALVRERDSLGLQKKRGELDEASLLRYEEVKKQYLEHRTEADSRSRKRVQEIRDVVDEYRPYAQVFVGGVSMIAADMIAFIQSDLVVFGIAVLLFMVVLLAVIFRSLKFVVIPMLCCLTAVGMMLGLVSWLDWRLTVISSNFVALLLIISLSIIIHLVVRYREYQQESPDWTKRQLVVATTRFMALPCFYTAVTTIVAFASLVVSNIRPVMDFGWMMTIGLILALVLAFLILPAALMVLPKGSVSSKENVTKKPLTAYFAFAVEHYGRIVLFAAICVFGMSLWGISLLKVENRFVDYFHDTTEIHQGLKVIDNQLGGTVSFDILIDVESIDNFVEAEALPSQSEFTDSDFDEFNNDFDDTFDESFDTGFDEGFEEEIFDDFADDPFSEFSDNVTSHWMTVAGLKKIEWVHDYLESLPEIGKVQSLATLYKVGQDINGNLNDFELALMEKALSNTIRDVLISPYLSPDGSQTRITMRVIDTYPGLERAELVDRIQSYLEKNAPFSSENTRYSGLLVLYNNMLQSLFSSQITTLGVVFVAIFFMLALVFRSLYVAAVAIVPNIVAALAVLGAMGLMGIPLDMMTITIAAITVGIGVDDTIHYIHRLKTELKLDGDYIASMHRAHTSIGRAMYYTSIIIVFGFGIMVLSQFIPTIYFGLLTGVAMFAALLGALLLLPKLILMTKPL